MMRKYACGVTRFAKCVPIVVIMLLASTGARSAEFTETRLKSGTPLILIEGEIKEGDDEKFRNITLRNSEAVIALESPGGLIRPALEIGRLIKLRGYATAVPSGFSCVSSCALIWMAGAPRLLSTDAKLGFHASYLMEGGKAVQTGVGNALIGHYLSQLNLPERAIIFATSASPDSVTWLTSKNAMASGIEIRWMEASPQSKSQLTRQKTDLSPPPLIAPVTSNPRNESLRSILHKPGFTDLVVDNFGFIEPSRSIMKDHLTLIYSRDDLVDKLDAELRSLSTIKGADLKSASFEIASALTQKLLVSGMTRISLVKKKKIYNYISKAANSATLEQCNSMFYGSGIKDGSVEFKLVALQGAEIFRDYLSLIRESVFAELDSLPAGVKLNDAQRRLAEQIVATELEKYLLGKDGEYAKRLATGIANLESAPNDVKCDYMKFIIKLPNALPEISGDLVTKYLVELSQE